MESVGLEFIRGKTGQVFPHILFLLAIWNSPWCIKDVVLSFPLSNAGPSMTSAPDGRSRNVDLPNTENEVPKNGEPLGTETEKSQIMEASNVTHSQSCSQHDAMTLEVAMSEKLRLRMNTLRAEHHLPQCISTIMYGHGESAERAQWPTSGADPGINYEWRMGVRKSMNIITKGEGGAQEYSTM